MDATPWLAQHPKGWVLRLHVQPGAKKTEFVGVYGDKLKMRLAAPPVDGKANLALIAYVAQRLDLPKHAVQVLHGATSREKDILLNAFAQQTYQDMAARLTAALGLATRP